ncbi:MAG: MotA/TolQ/ExbB proton channel family protein [Bdellovibrionaceae bacterium]|nr:MotA/TolQ/ExbB proton channel family protein [Pseudobdellovibrionaceae bacterium]
MSFFITIIEAFQNGGFWMWVILALQLVSIAIIAERVFTLYFKEKMQAMITAYGFEKAIKKGELSTLIKDIDEVQTPSVIGHLTKEAAITALDLGGKEEIQSKMDETLLQENNLLERRIGFLPMLANVGTLTGLLGTIVGMIKSFTAVSQANPAEKAALLSSGISEAMNTTAYGLIMAIPALIAFAILNNRSSHLIEDLNQAALKVFNWFSYSYEVLPEKVALESSKTEVKRV